MASLAASGSPGFFTWDAETSSSQSYNIELAVSRSSTTSSSSTTSPNLPSTCGTYTVKSGDSMSSIATAKGVTLAALEAANPQVTNPNLIQVGQVLNLPC